MQIAAMRQQIGRTEFRFGALAKDHVELDLAGAPVAVVPGARIEGLLAHALLEAKPAQHLHGVTADLDAGAETGELLCLFVDGDVDANFSERGRGGEATHARTDDRHVERPCHPRPRFHAGLKPACSSALRPASDASASRNACTAGRCLRAFTSAKS